MTHALTCDGCGTTAPNAYPVPRGWAIFDVRLADHTSILRHACGSRCLAQILLREARRADALCEVRSLFSGGPYR